MKRPVVGISMGDPSGIGPEILASALRHPRIRKQMVPVVFGDLASLHAHTLFRTWPVQSELAFRPTEPVLCAVSNLPATQRRLGKPSVAGGRAQFEYLTAVIAAARSGWVDAICTAPVSKEQITKAGIPFFGHTEVLAKAFGVDVLMLMDGPRLRVALATNHVPLAKVPKALNVPRLVSQLQLLSTGLRGVLQREPKIAVCGLNPHAGEGGHIGSEEEEILIPAIARARRSGVDCHGPFAADGLFAKSERMPFDAVLAMYHDQGLVATKALDFERTVNVTLGLPVPRTSPDHGVAYDIAGKNIATAVPMMSALEKAASMAAAFR